jgi:hypothetical protein
LCPKHCPAQSSREAPPAAQHGVLASSAPDADLRCDRCGEVGNGRGSDAPGRAGSQHARPRPGKCARRCRCAGARGGWTCSTSACTRISCRCDRRRGSTTKRRIATARPTAALRGMRSLSRLLLRACAHAQAQFADTGARTHLCVCVCVGLSVRACVRVCLSVCTCAWTSVCSHRPCVRCVRAYGCNAMRCNARIYLAQPRSQRAPRLAYAGRAQAHATAATHRPRRATGRRRMPRYPGAVVGGLGQADKQ